MEDAQSSTAKNKRTALAEPTDNHVDGHNTTLKELTVISTNACSILHKMDELHSFVSQKLPNVISITESWLHPDISDAEFHLDDYILFRNDSLGWWCSHVCCQIPQPNCTPSTARSVIVVLSRCPSH